MRFQFQRRGVPGRVICFFRPGLQAEICFCFFKGACRGGASAPSAWGRFGFVCVPSASRGRAVERAFHLLLNALNGPTANAALAGNPQHALAEAQLSLNGSIRGLPSCLPCAMARLRPA
jgi:hypothetical protein